MIEYVTYNELYDAYCVCRKRKRSSPNSMEFEFDDFINLYKLHKDLNSLNYKIGKSIAFCVNEPVKREVFAADFRDRIVHHLFINRTMSFFEQQFINDTYSCRVGKGTDYGIQRCQKMIEECSKNYTKKCYILKCDLKSFFMTIDKDILYNKLDDFLKNICQFTDNNLYFMQYLLKIIIYNRPQDNCILKQPKSSWDNLPSDKSLFNVNGDKGLPIGNLTSQIFANFFLNDFDKYITEILGFKNYGRYVDDFFIIREDKEKLKRTVLDIKNYLQQINVILHPKKIYLQEVNKGVTFLGKVIKPHRKYAGKRTVKKFWKKLKEWSGYLEHLKTINQEPTKQDIYDFICSMNSYFGYMRHCNTYNIRKKIMQSKYMRNWWQYVYLKPNLIYLLPYREYALYGNLTKYVSQTSKDIKWCDNNRISPKHF